MKKLLLLGLLFGGAFTMNSCLEYDEPGDELEMNQKLYQYEKAGTNADNGGENA